MPRHILSLTLVVLSLIFAGFFPKPTANPNNAPALTPISIYGAWHCGNDFCTWSTVRNMTDFDTKNRWLINRGNGQPSVNLVVLSFVHPMRLLNKTTDAQTSQGIPIGMNQAVVDYFKTRVWGSRCQLADNYTDGGTRRSHQPNSVWMNVPRGQRLGVDIELDYEENTIQI